MLLKRIDLACLWLEVKYFRTQKAAAMRRCACSTHLLLLLTTTIVSVVTASSVLLAHTDLVCLRICIVVRDAGLGECRRPPDASGSTLRLPRHLLVSKHLRCLLMHQLLIGHLSNQRQNRPMRTLEKKTVKSAKDTAKQKVDSRR